MYSFCTLSLACKLEASLLDNGEVSLSARLDIINTGYNMPFCVVWVASLGLCFPSLASPESMCPSSNAPTSGIKCSEDADALAPAFQPGVEIDLIWERIGVTGGNGRDMILIVVHRVHHLERGLPQSRRHRPQYLRALCGRSTILAIRLRGPKSLT